MNDQEINAGKIVRKLVKQDNLEPSAGRWRLTFDDGLVVETIRQEGPGGKESHWEARVVEPIKAHLNVRFASHNAAYRFVMRDHVRHGEGGHA